MSEQTEPEERTTKPSRRDRQAERALRHAETTPMAPTPAAPQTAAPPPAPPKLAPHACYRCRKSDGLSAYCSFCEATTRSNINARVLDILEHPPKTIARPAWDRAIFATLDCCPNGQHPCELGMYVNLQYQVVRRALEAAFGE